MLPEDFAALMAPLGVDGPLAVAVSGGGDSMALLHLAADWARARNRSVTAFTVDHGLRAEASLEAARVAGWCAAIGAPHETLRWAGAKPGARLQEAARGARYALLADACVQRNISAILAAHTEDDQAETVLQRLAHGSGLDGLAGMAPEIRIAAGAGASVRLLRPLLGVSRATLRATLAGIGQAFIEDPSNDDGAFERVRARRAIAGLAADGVLSASALAATAAQLRLHKDALIRRAEAGATATKSILETGVWDHAAEPFLALPDETAVAALRRLLYACGGGLYSPSGDAAMSLLRALRAQETVRRTLSGCLVERRQTCLRIMREPSGLLGRANAPAAPPQPFEGDSLLWDRRYAVTLARGTPRPNGLCVGAFGAFQPLEFEMHLEHPPPEAARLTLPALCAEGAVLVQPHVGYVAPGAETLAAGLRAVFLGEERFFGDVVRYEALF